MGVIKMTILKKKLISIGIIVSVCAMTGVAHADVNALNEGWYLGGSVGQSKMNPGTEGTNWRTDDKKDMSKKIYVGKEFNDRLGIEAFWTDLGVAGLKSSSGAEGKIGYKGTGANITYKVPKRFGNFEPFAKLGVTRLKTDNRENVVREQLNKTSVMAGVGIDYIVSDQWQVRSEFDYYDKDITDLNVGLKWKPGYKPHTHNRVERPQQVIIQPKRIAKPAPTPTPKIVYVPKKVYVTRPAPKPVPKPQYQVMRRSLTGGSNFASASAELTVQGKNALNRLVSDINNQKISVNSIDIVGHTDSVGSSQSNQQLSINRANSVARYLTSRGIAQSMLRTNGLGESQPIADNNTAQGKAKNRRVEMAINVTSREIIRRQ